MNFLLIMRFKSVLIDNVMPLASTPFHYSPFNCIQIKCKTSGGKKPKKRIYYREHVLDKVMDLQKKPSLILELKNIIESQKTQSMLLRDLEKEVGFVRKWNFMSVIEKYPTIFHVTGGNNRTPVTVRLTEKAQRVAGQECEARMLMEPILVKNLRKLLMLTVDCRVPLEKVECIQNEMGLPTDFKETIIRKYPEFFSVKDFNGKDHLNLEHWDSSLAITAREENVAEQGVLIDRVNEKRARISKDGNYAGPHAFGMCYPAGFRPNAGYLEELERWQKMEFPSPYLNARKFESADRKARKRMVGVLHELLSLTIEKRMTSFQMHMFHSELLLPARLILCLVKHHGIFYITNKGVRSTVFLKEAYEGSHLIDKCPILRFYDKFVELSGRRVVDVSGEFSQKC